MEKIKEFINSLGYAKYILFVLLLYFVFTVSVVVYAQQFNRNNAVIPKDQNNNLPAVLTIYDQDTNRYYYLSADTSGIIDVKTDKRWYIRHVDDQATPNYYGYTDKSGDWYIMEQVLNDSTDSYQYVAGSDGSYDTAWVGRGTLSYSDYEDIF